MKAFLAVLALVMFGLLLGEAANTKGPEGTIALFILLGGLGWILFSNRN